MRIILIPVIAVFFATSALGQGFQPVFPGLNGQVLLDSLFSRYLPLTVLDYGMARDTLFSKVLAIDDDTLRCIYSGHALYLDPTQDPTQYVYLNGGMLGINTEHAYPQSKGAANGNARSDMHHLYPARIPVNEARGDRPFAEIPDNQTDKWFRNAQVQTGIPTQNIEQYAEANEIYFEPREKVKGDMARSIFYFYTMYRNQANIADPNFFELQRATLCAWNVQDPADSIELRKTWRIAHWQEGKPNPFVLDCTLANRCWCPETPPNCSVGVTTSAPERISLQLQLNPQPASDQTRLTGSLPFEGNLHGTLRNSLGQNMAEFSAEHASAGAISLPIDLTALGQQHTVLFLEITLRNAQQTLHQVLPLLLSR